ncbi:hypothetical protein J22TS1_44160 [Siminovitchia terrae]|uniref:hypothetical protein n=1 Tax=Siminovitchia terrae TaxID=1914933 RepID=UPI001B0DCDCC|nr:hypothetical protein [Siminovitchia terrae]GIN93365.1 hypothetical protein J22TS1_44160 [Siminovitchia terrae]
MSFDTSKGTVYPPLNPMLNSVYNALKKHAPSLKDCPAFDDFVEAYEALEYDMRGEMENESITSIRTRKLGRTS